MSLLYPREMLAEVIEERRVDMAPSERAALFALVDTVFFASLMLEEGEPVRVAIVHDEGGAAGLASTLDATPDAWGEDGPPPAWDVTPIAPIAFTPRNLAKLSRGLDYGTHLAVVGGPPHDLYIDGIARRTPRTDGGDVTRIAAPRPGVIVFELQHRELLRFDAGERVPAAIDVLSGHCCVREAVGAITGDMGVPGAYSASERAIMQLLRRMRSTGSGAILAMLPEPPSEQMLTHVRYRRMDIRSLVNRIRLDWDYRWTGINAAILTMSGTTWTAQEIREIARRRAASEAAREALDAAISDVAQSSAIDGSVLAGPGLDIYGAGYIIPVIQGIRPVRSLDAHMTRVEPFPRVHGARHEAAFSFVHMHPGGVAFIVSEDGPVSCALAVGDRVVVWPVYLSET